MWAGAAISLGVASAAAGQQSGKAGAPPVNTSQSLHLPENPQLFGTTMPSVIKATAIVNGSVITQTDVDQRLAFLSIANNQPIPAEQIDALRQQILRNLIDETLEIQAAKTEKIDIKKSDIDRTVERVAAGFQADHRSARRLPSVPRLVDRLAASSDRRRDCVAPAPAVEDRGHGRR